VTDRLPHPLRSDARDNRELILDAARALFAAEGLNVPMREIARRAGVGPATLYRRFPTKETLVTEALAGQMRACHAIVDEGLADPDPWHGLCLVIEKICELHARNRGFTAAFMSAFPSAMDFAADREYALRSIAGLARRARDAGACAPTSSWTTWSSCSWPTAASAQPQRPRRSPPRGASPRSRSRPSGPPRRPRRYRQRHGWRRWHCCPEY
jgi:AcrR family transcriptional regulator